MLYTCSKNLISTFNLFSKISVLLLAGLVSACNDKASNSDQPIKDNQDSSDFISVTPDTVTGSINQPIIIDVLENDSSLNNELLTIAGYSQPQNGSLALQDGLFRYTPSPDYSGADKFYYHVKDESQHLIQNVEVTINIEPSNNTDPHIEIGLSTITSNEEAGAVLSLTHSEGVSYTRVANTESFDSGDSQDLVTCAMDAETQQVSGTMSRAGECYIFFTDRQRFTSQAIPNVSEDGDTPKFLTVSGPHVDAGFGRDIYPIGDVNGDQLADIAISYMDESSSAAQPNHSIVVLLGRDSAESIDLSHVNFSSSTTENLLNFDGALIDMAQLGDVNGDGYDDFTVTVHSEDKEVTYLVKGSESFGSLTLESAPLANVITIAGSGLEFSGGGVYLGDLTSDGRNDFALITQQLSAGVPSLVLFSGDAEAFGVDREISFTDITNHLKTVRYKKSQGEFSGNIEVTALGDINQDSYSDLVIRSIAGSFIYYSSAFENGEVLSSRAPGFMELPEKLRVLGSGDMNGDQYADIVFSERDSNQRHSKAEAVYVLYGNGEPLTFNTRLRNLAEAEGGDGSRGAVILPESLNTSSDAVALLDIDRDGYDDLILGGVKRAYIIYGGPKFGAVN